MHQSAEQVTEEFQATKNKAEHCGALMTWRPPKVVGDKDGNSCGVTQDDS